MTSEGSVRKLSFQKGVALLEVTLALAALVILALVVLKASLNVVEAQRWTVTQSMTDAYMTREVAFAGRIPFSDLHKPDATSWPTYPESAQERVEVGKLPGAVPVFANIIRTKYAAKMNLNSKGGTNYTSGNPTRMETWLLKSFLTYDFSGRDYVKSRTTIRVR